MKDNTKPMVAGIACVDQRRLVIRANTLDQLRKVLEQVSFIRVGLNGGGVVKLPDGMKFPVLSHPLDSLRISPARLGQGETEQSAFVVDLPDEWVYLWGHLEQVLQGRTMRRSRAKRYAEKLWKRLAQKARLEILQSQWGPGIQADADSLPEAAPGEIYISPRMLKLFIPHIVRWVKERAEKKLARKYAGEVLAEKVTQVVEALESRLRQRGLEGLNIRFPVAGKEGARWVVLRVLKGLRGKKLYLNPADLQLLLGGDTDGDLVYVGLAGLRFGQEHGPLPAPRVRMFDEIPEDRIGLRDALRIFREKLPAKTPESARVQVLSACIKDLTGLLTHVFHVMARGAAYTVFQETGDPLEIQRVYQDTFSIYFPLIEEVMDARKKAGEEGIIRVHRIARALEGMLGGSELDVEAFQPFLPLEQQLEDLVRLYRLSGKLQSAGITVGGRLVSAGRRKEHAVEEVCTALRKRGKTPMQVLQALREDILFQQVHPAPEAVERGEREAEEVRTPPPLPLDSLVEAFTSIQYVGKHGDPPGEPKAIFIPIGRKMVEGAQVVTFRFVPWWMVSSAECRTHYTLEVVLPSVRKATEHGHRYVQLPGEGERFFRPVLRRTDDGHVSLYDARNDLRLALFRLIQDFIPKAGKATGKYWTQDNTIQARITRCVRDWVHGMEPADPRRDFINQEEFLIDVPPHRDVRRRWAELEQVLDWASARGWDISATGKGTPGDRCSLADEHGFAHWGYHFNPFWRFGNWARHNQLVSGIKDALPLRFPSLPEVELEGYPFPEEYEECVTSLNVALFNCNLNQFPDHEGNPRAVRYDTVLVLPLGVERLQVAYQDFEVQEEQLEAFKERLQRVGIGPDQLEIQEVPEHLGLVEGQPCRILKHRIRVTGTGWDEGKFASLIGPLKGVMTVPRQLRRAWVVRNGVEHPIHVVWESQSAWKKADPAMLLAMAAGKAGLRKIRKEWELEETVERIEAALEEAGLPPDGREAVWVEYADGHIACLGEAYVGPLPCYRPPQTEAATCRILTHDGPGLKVESHAQFLAMREGKTIGYPDRPEQDVEFCHLLHAIRFMDKELGTK